MLSKKERERRKKISAASKQAWKNKKVRKERLASLRKVHDDPVYRRKLSKGVTKHYASKRGAKHRRTLSKSSTGLWKTDAYRKKVSRRVSKAKRKQWGDLVFKGKMSEAFSKSVKHNSSDAFRRSCDNSRMSKSVKVVDKALIDLGLTDYEFQGAKQRVIGRRTPDFLSVRKKKCIEVYGSIHRKKGAKEKDKQRLKEIGSFGYKVLVIWDTVAFGSFTELKKMIKKFDRSK